MGRGGNILYDQQSLISRQSGVASHIILKDFSPPAKENYHSDVYQSFEHAINTEIERYKVNEVNGFQVGHFQDVFDKQSLQGFFNQHTNRNQPAYLIAPEAEHFGSKNFPIVAWLSLRYRKPIQKQQILEKMLATLRKLGLYPATSTYLLGSGPVTSITNMACFTRLKVDKKDFWVEPEVEIMAAIPPAGQSRRYQESIELIKEYGAIDFQNSGSGKHLRELYNETEAKHFPFINR